jgi:hypothetical protein
LAFALLPVGVAVIWAGVELGCRGLERDPWRIVKLPALSLGVATARGLGPADNETWVGRSFGFAAAFISSVW